MLLSALIGFFLGIILPATASRFGKLLPADPGWIILNLWHKPHFPKASAEHAKRLRRKWAKLVFYSLLWGFILAELFGLASLSLNSKIAGWAYIFISLIAFCIVIDKMYSLLPDFFTIPLLIIGFGASVFMPVLTSIDSFIGAACGYFIATISMILMGRKSNAEIGAGDVKLMAAIGAWLGVSGLNFTLLLSFFLFAVPATFHGQKKGPYGPALGIAAIISFFFAYMN